MKNQIGIDDDLQRACISFFLNDHIHNPLLTIPSSKGSSTHATMATSSLCSLEAKSRAMIVKKVDRIFVERFQEKFKTEIEKTLVKLLHCSSSYLPAGANKSIRPRDAKKTPSGHSIAKMLKTSCRSLYSYVRIHERYHKTCSMQHIFSTVGTSSLNNMWLELLTTVARCSFSIHHVGREKQQNRCFRVPYLQTQPNSSKILWNTCTSDNEGVVRKNGICTDFI